MAACVPSSSWPAGGGRKPSGNPVEPPIVLSLLTAWNFKMQQLVLCGATPHVTVREARFGERRSRRRPVARRERGDDAGLAVEHEERARGGRHDVAVELRQELHPLEQHVAAVDGQCRVQLVGGCVDARGNREPGAGARVYEPDLEALAGLVTVVGGDQPRGRSARRQRGREQERRSGRQCRQSPSIPVSQPVHASPRSLASVSSNRTARPVGGESAGKPAPGRRVKRLIVRASRQWRGRSVWAAHVNPAGVLDSLRPTDTGG